jgi:hypothetical protein
MRLVVGEVFGLGRTFTDHIALAGIRRIAPHPPLLTMQQITQHLRIVYVGGGGHHRMHELGLAIRADMRLHAEVPLVALLGLAHLGITLFVFVFGRGRGIDDGGIIDRPRADLQALRLQMLTDRGKQALAQVMCFQQMTEFAFLVSSGAGSRPRSMPRHARSARESYSASSTLGLRQIEPLLDKVDAQHPLKTHRPTTRTGRLTRIHRRDHGTQLRPGHHRSISPKKRSRRVGLR